MLKREHHDWTENKAKKGVNACHRGMSIQRAAEFMAFQNQLYVTS